MNMVELVALGVLIQNKRQTEQTNNDVYIYYNSEYYDLDIMQIIKQMNKVDE